MARACSAGISRGSPTSCSSWCLRSFGNALTSSSSSIPRALRVPLICRSLPWTVLLLASAVETLLLCTGMRLIGYKRQGILLYDVGVEHYVKCTCPLVGSFMISSSLSAIIRLTRCSAMCLSTGCIGVLVGALRIASTVTGWW